MTDPITQQVIAAPPGLGYLRASAYTWLHDQPWYAAAGEKRGVLDEWLSVDFPKLSDDAKEAMYGNHPNCINPIVSHAGAIMTYGDQTMLRISPGAADKLTAIHNLVLVEYVVQGLSAIARKYVFDPNDQTLLDSLNSDMNQFLKAIMGLRGIDGYKLVCDTTNNTAATRNQRYVVVDLYVIPTDVAEKIFINAVVRESGANLTNVTP